MKTINDRLVQFAGALHDTIGSSGGRETLKDYFPSPRRNLSDIHFVFETPGQGCPDTEPEQIGTLMRTESSTILLEACSWLLDPSDRAPLRSPLNEPTQEEDFTMECICGFEEGDTSMILCDSCLTWQHMECYYMIQGIKSLGNEEQHYCCECDPRPLNSESAVMWQREKKIRHRFR